MTIQPLVKPLTAILCAVTLSACSTSPTYGKQGVLSDQKGMTYYIFDKDAKGTGTSACYGSCAATWPPVASSTSKGSGFSAITRKGGSKQLTFNGSPIYYFAGDSKTGDRNGDGIGGTWHIINTTKNSTASSPLTSYGLSY